METIRTSCVLDCPDTCALNVTVQDGRVTKLTGSHDHPDTQGFICAKVSKFHKRVYHPDRLLHPMRRTGPKGSGQFERITWEEACSHITKKLKDIRDTHGGEAILPYHYGGSNGILSEEYLDSLFFAELGASQLDKTICAAPSTAARTGMYGSMPGGTFKDVTYAKFILIWGANTKGSNIHLAPYLKEAKKKGAVIVSIDPMSRFSKTEVDLNLNIRPGTDLALALAFIRIWQEDKLLNKKFINQWTVNSEGILNAARYWDVARAARQCGVSEENIRVVANAYAREELALIRCGWGQERNLNGGQATAAILALPALLGKFGRRGSGFIHSNSGATSFNRDAVLGPIKQDTRTINMTQLSKALNEPQSPPVKGLFVYNSNPVATTPDQQGILKGMAREDLFTVVFEQVMTDTAVFADILLPATTFLEQYEIRKAYGSWVVGGAKPVIPPMGEAKSNLEVFAMLGRAMGSQNPAFQWSEETHFNKAASAIKLGEQTADAAVLRQGLIHAHDHRNGGPVPFETLFPKDKVDLTPKVLGPTPYHFIDVEQQGYPLAFVSPASEKLITSTFGEFNLEKLQVYLHPNEAEKRGLEDGAAVRVFNTLGEVHCHLKVTNRMAQGSALMPKGAWRKSSLNAMTSTALCPDHVEITAGGACFNDARVEIEALSA